MKTRDRQLAVLDLGSSTVNVLVAETDGNGGLRLCGSGSAESKGFRKNVLINLDAAVDATRQAVEAAEQAAGLTVERAVISVAGAHIRSVNSRGGVSLGLRPREVVTEDVRRAIEAAQSVSLPPGQELLHVLPQEYLLDNQSGIRDPLGLLGRRLEVNVHLVTSEATTTQNLVSVANRAGVVVEDTVLVSLAAAHACLTRDERELGVVLADIGGGSTNWIILEHGAPRASGVLPVGGEHFTNDIAIGLRVPLWEAERIKRAYGCAGLRWIGQDTLLEVASLGERPARVTSRRALCEIIEPRALELLEMLREELDHSGYGRLPATGLVLTGGGAQLDGLAELAAQFFQWPVRVGLPQGLLDAGGTLADAACATPVGLLLHAQRLQRARLELNGDWWGRLRTFFSGRAA